VRRPSRLCPRRVADTLRARQFPLLRLAPLPPLLSSLVVSSCLFLLLWIVAVFSSPIHGWAAIRAASGALFDLRCYCASVPGRRL